MDNEETTIKEDMNVAFMYWKFSYFRNKNAISFNISSVHQTFCRYCLFDTQPVYFVPTKFEMYQIKF